MPQFDVHPNPGRHRAAVPFVVTIQSSRFDHAPTRLMAPLLDAALADKLLPPALLPRFIIAGRAVILDPFKVQSVPRAALGPAIASLADDDSASRIVNALDAVLSRAYG